MKIALKLQAFAAAALGISCFNAFAGESIVYEFKDGTVTITPRSSSRVTAPSPAIQANYSTSQPDDSIQINPGPRRLYLQPVSLVQETPTPPPAPMPETVAPPINPLPASPVPAATTLPNPLPPLSQSTAVPAPAPCCDEPIIRPRPSNPLPPATVTTSTAAMYREVYNSIPFSRVEFNHYPNYRHDATMEFLFNQMRPTLMNRNTSALSHDYYGPLYSSYMGYPYYDPPAYPFSYGLRIHRSR